MSRTKPQHNIDYETFTFDGCLKKIINTSTLESNKSPQLGTAWTVKFPPKESSKFLRLIKQEVTEKDPIPFPFLKRIQKVTEEEETFLWAIVCSTELVVEASDISTLMNKYSIDARQVLIQEVPRNYPHDKETSDHWGSMYWPMIWKGNPLIQELNQITIPVPTIIKCLKEISTRAKLLKEQKKLPIVTMFRDPTNEENTFIQDDDREGKSILKHSIMECIEKIAEAELSRRQAHKDTESDMRDKNYLCLNYEVYTTHEPCAMCVMALIHSRVSRLVYINSVPQTGSVEETSGLGYGYEEFSGLNWKFDSWKWCGEDLEVPALDENAIIFA